MVWFANEETPVKQFTTKYLCGVDFQHEMDEGCASLFDDLTELKACRACWPMCGIVEIKLDAQGRVVAHKWLEEQAL